jgi:hypothetical protein
VRSLPDAPAVQPARHLAGEQDLADQAPTAILTPEQIELQLRLEGIFMPYARKQRDKIYENQDKPTRFVHYTSAEAALSIIRSKRVWMRNTTCMSDYREVQHGYGILYRFFTDTSKREAFIKALDACYPGVAQEALNLFDQWWQHEIQFNTYIFSISEHDNKEDQHGRLSMWRAFGGSSPKVAVVIDIPKFSGGVLALNLMFSPVAYLTEDEVHTQLHSVTQNIGAEANFLKSVDRSRIVAITFNMLAAAVTCLKHEGFHEEREWRAIYAPKRSPSPLMEFSTECIGGVPQTVYHLPLDAKKSELLAELDLFRMFDRLIVGPSPYPLVMYEAFAAALTSASVADVNKRILISGIPIRGP